MVVMVMGLIPLRPQVAQVAQEAEVAQITVVVEQVFQVKATTVHQAAEEYVQPVAVVEKVAVEVLGMAEAVQVTLS
jgi:hypothetical protein